MSHRYDIVIVGAGLAGLGAARAILHRSSPRLLLVDDRAKARSITPLTFADVVTGFGLEGSVLHVYHSFSMHSPLGSQSRHDFQAPTLVALDYARACQIMGEEIAEFASLQRVYSRVTALRRVDRAWTLTLDTGERLRCDLVIDASGQAQLSGDVLGRSRSPSYSHCYGERLAGCEIDDEGTCYFLGGGGRFGTGGGWFYPLGNGTASFGYARVTHSRRYPASQVEDGYHRARTLFEPYAGIVSGARRLTVETGSIPVGPTLPFIDDGLMRVGDAAGQATPWMCMGVEPALVNGTLCGQVAAAAYHRGAFGSADLRDYERTWKEVHQSAYRQAMLLAPLQWVEDEEQWDQAIASQDRLTSDEMLAKLRDNYPQWPLTTLLWFRLYDWLGKMRRGIGKWIHSHLQTAYARKRASMGLSGDSRRV